MKKIIIKTKSLFIVLLLCLFAFLLINQITVKATIESVSISTDFGFDSKNNQDILGEWYGITSHNFFAESQNQSLNNVEYEKVKALKMANSNYLEYEFNSEQDIRDVNLYVYGIGNSTSANASYVLTAYNDQELIGSSDSKKIIVESINNSFKYTDIVSKVLSTTPIMLHVESISNITKIRLTLNANCNTILSRIILDYQENTTSFDEFSNLTTKSSLKINYNKEEKIDILSYDKSTNNYLSTTSLASSLNLDEKKYSVTGMKNEANYTISLNGNSQEIRLYGYNCNGAMISVSRLDDVNISQIKVNFVENYNVGYEVKALNTVVNSSNDIFSFPDNTTSFTIQNINNDRTEIRIKSIEITTFSGININNENTAIRFGTVIEKQLYDRLIENGANEFGVVISKKNELGNNTLTVQNALYKEIINPVRVSNFSSSVEDLNGNYYQFALVINNVPLKEYTTEMVASCYVKKGSVYYLMNSSCYSIATLATKYLENYQNEITGFEICENHLDVLDYLKEMLITKPPLSIYYLDLVGKPGDASLIKIGNVEILVDGGDKDSVSENNLSDLLEAKVEDGIIEYVVATHPDTDHFNGLTNVFNNYIIDTLFKYSTNKTNSSLQAWDKVISDEGCHVNLIYDWLNGASSKTLTINNDINIEFYNTGSYMTGSNSNASSIVFLLNAYSTKVLFSGDAETEQEAIYTSLCGDVDIYSMGHHGSNGGTSTSGLSKMMPEVVIAQVGDYLGNGYGHPTYEAMKRVYQNNYNTCIYSPAGGNFENSDYYLDRNGTIIVSITEDGYVLNSTLNNGVIIEMRETAYWNNEKNSYRNLYN